MISKITLSNIATYTMATAEPKKINFIYGGNGTGKTTLSRFLAGEDANSGSIIEWTSTVHEKIIVYNRDFIERNFSADKTLPGIFTLGSKSIDIQNEIENLKEQSQQQKEIREKTAKSLEGLLRTINDLSEETRNKCWEIQSKYGTAFSSALVGYRSSRDKFFQECLALYPTREKDEAKIPTYERLKEIYHSAYAKNISPVKEYSEIDIMRVTALDSQPLLSKIITGTSNTPIGTFIQFLNASDWVKQGIELAEKSNGRCPFCQQELPSSLAEQIAAFFDEEYKKGCTAIKEYQCTYSEFVAEVELHLKSILDSNLSFLQYHDFEQLSLRFHAVSAQNLNLIQSKIENPSKPIKCDSLCELVQEINKRIRDFNVRIKENNAIISNQEKARAHCQYLVWQFFLLQLEDVLSDYNKQATGLHKGATSIKAKVDAATDRIKILEGQIHKKEAQLTSVLPTVSAINKILYNFGFVGFSLAENRDKPGTYLILRPDGTDASRTLSEGEHNFISFLYFYHLCFGSQTNTGLADDKVVVIDDPISSLDSNVLFVVSTLVKNVIQNCLKKNAGISQVFILTHNIYFHKEITFLGSRESYSPKEVAYYIIRKRDEESSLQFYSSNPIKTSYQTLWEELKEPNISSSKSAFNTMRRILEHYFQIIGGIKYEECINSFDGEDQLVCKALIAFINDGSHSIFDDLIVSFDDTMLDSYLRVFRLIFLNLHHIDHYNMMMGIPNSG